MSSGDLLFLAVRWLHLLSAVAWVGGAAFYFLVLQPVLRASNSHGSAFSRIVAAKFRSLATLCTWALLLTGTILVLDRLTNGFLGSAYLAALGTKIFLALVIFAIVRARRRHRLAISPEPSAGHGQRTLTRHLTGGATIIFLAILVLLLSDILRFLVEQDLEGG